MLSGAAAGATVFAGGAAGDRDGAGVCDTIGCGAAVAGVAEWFDPATETGC
jgi:hypothetical protein